MKKNKFNLLKYLLIYVAIFGFFFLLLFWVGTFFEFDFGIFGNFIICIFTLFGAPVLTFIMIKLSIQIKNVLVQYEAKYEELASNVNLKWNKYIEIQKQSIKMIKKIRKDEANEYEKFKLEEVDGDTLHILAKQYPELKANFEEAASNLEDLYEEYTNSRKKLNALIADYNAYIASFPVSFFSNMFGYVKMDVIGQNSLKDAMHYERKEKIDDFDKI